MKLEQFSALAMNVKQKASITGGSSSTGNKSTDTGGADKDSWFRDKDTGDDDDDGDAGGEY